MSETLKRRKVEDRNKITKLIEICRKAFLNIKNGNFVFFKPLIFTLREYTKNKKGPELDEFASGLYDVLHKDVNIALRTTGNPKLWCCASVIDDAWRLSGDLVLKKKVTNGSVYNTITMGIFDTLHKEREQDRDSHRMMCTIYTDNASIARGEKVSYRSPSVLHEWKKCIQKAKILKMLLCDREFNEDSFFNKYQVELQFFKDVVKLSGLRFLNPE